MFSATSHTLNSYTNKALWHLFVIITSLTIVAHLASCGYKGEPMYVDTGNAADTVTNDLTYTAVTGNINLLSAVAVTLNGFANSNTVISTEVSDQGFLISRFNENPSFDAADLYEPNSKNYVRRISITDIHKDNSMTCRVHGLIPETQFFYRAYVVRNGKVFHGVVRTFATLELETNLNMVPDHNDLFEAQFSGSLWGLRTADDFVDYGNDVELCFRMQDVDYAQVCDTVQPSFKQSQSSYLNEYGTRRIAQFHGLTAGARYYVRAYAHVQSDFYDYETDNPIDEETGRRLYGERAEDIATDKYVSQTMVFDALDLKGVVAFSCDYPNVEYNIATFTDCYFVLPTDTLVANEYGVAIVSTNEDGEIMYDHHKSTDTELRRGNRYSVRIDKLPLASSFKYVAYVNVRGLYFYSTPVRNFVTHDYTPGFVDLGLPSGTIWGDRNIGAYSPEIAGQYYAWGELTSKVEYTDYNYVGPTDAIQIAGSQYDAARDQWGEEWSIPTFEDFQELYYECNWRWARIEKTNGILVTSPFNEKTIFFPAVGIRTSEGKTEENGLSCHYWTSERNVNASTQWGLIYEMFFTNGMSTTDDWLPRHQMIPIYGAPIRPVRKL